MSPLDVLWLYGPAFASGLLVTAELVGIALIAGTTTGLFLERVCQKSPPIVRRMIDGTAFAVSALPALVILFWFYYPGQAVLGISISPFWTASAALALMNALGVYRIAADSWSDVPTQYAATARVCGLNER